MPEGYSLHVGLNRTSSERYGDGRYSQLFGCDRAAHAMASIAEERGYKHRQILTTPENVTLSAVTNWLKSTASKAKADDIVLFTFAGHGDLVMDSDGDEPVDQAMVLYDSLLIDDEIYERLGNFVEGVRVVVVADCCYGGSIISMMNKVAALAAHEPQPDATQGPAFRRPYVKADALLLSACRDTSQTAAAQAGDALPPFTRKLMNVWEASGGGAFKDGYLGLETALGKGGPFLFPDLVHTKAVLTQQPFSI
jgi:hypothetical protein